MIESQAYLCAISGWSLTPETASLDHITPVSRGGELKAIANVQIVHTVINRMKGTMTNEEFISACKAVAGRHQ